MRTITNTLHHVLKRSNAVTFENRTGFDEFNLSIREKL